MAVITLLIVSLIVFTLMELVPGTCAERYLAFKNTQGSGISVEDIEADPRHSEEIDGPGYIQMVPQERQPSARSLVRYPGLEHVPADRVFTGRNVLKQNQRITDPLSAP